MQRLVACEVKLSCAHRPDVMHRLVSLLISRDEPKSILSSITDVRNYLLHERFRSLSLDSACTTKAFPDVIGACFVEFLLGATVRDEIKSLTVDSLKSMDVCEILLSFQNGDVKKLRSLLTPGEDIMNGGSSSRVSLSPAAFAALVARCPCRSAESMDVLVEIMPIVQGWNVASENDGGALCVIFDQLQVEAPHLVTPLLEAFVRGKGADVLQCVEEDELFQKCKDPAINVLYKCLKDASLDTFFDFHQGKSGSASRESSGVTSAILPCDSSRTIRDLYIGYFCSKKLSEKFSEHLRWHGSLLTDGARIEILRELNRRVAAQPPSEDGDVEMTDANSAGASGKRASRSSNLTGAVSSLSGRAVSGKSPRSNGNIQIGCAACSLYWHCWGRFPNYIFNEKFFPRKEEDHVFMHVLKSEETQFEAKCEEFKHNLSVVGIFLTRPETLKLSIYNSLAAEKLKWFYGNQESNRVATDTKIEETIYLIGQEGSASATYPPYYNRWHFRPLPEKLKSKLLAGVTTKVQEPRTTMYKNFAPRVSEGISPSLLKYNLEVFLAWNNSTGASKLSQVSDKPLDRHLIGYVLVSWFRAAGLEVEELVQVVADAVKFRSFWKEYRALYKVEPRFAVRPTPSPARHFAFLNVAYLVLGYRVCAYVYRCFFEVQNLWLRVENLFPCRLANEMNSNSGKRRACVFMPFPTFVDVTWRDDDVMDVPIFGLSESSANVTAQRLNNVNT